MSNELRNETRESMLNEMREYIKTKAPDIYAMAKMTGYSEKQIVAIIKEGAGEFTDVVNIYVAYQTIVQEKTEDMIKSNSMSK